jgi:hypothetical protein
MRCILIALMLIMSVTAVAVPLPMPQNNSEANSTRFTEITMERVWDNCIDCGDYKVFLRRDATGPYKDATVTYILTKSKEQRQGKLYAYFYNELTRLIESEGYFKLNDSYCSGVVDTLITKTSVVRDGKRKTILNNAGRVPIELWGWRWLLMEYWQE